MLVSMLRPRKIESILLYYVHQHGFFFNHLVYSIRMLLRLKHNNQ